MLVQETRTYRKWELNRGIRRMLRKGWVVSSMVRYKRVVTLVIFERIV